MKNFILFYLLLFCLKGYNQIKGTSNDYRTNQFDKHYRGKMDAITNGVQGSVYLFDEKQITKGKIFYTNNSGLEINNINYNLFSNTIESKYAEDSTFVIDDSSIKEIIINRLKYKMISIEGKKTFCEQIFKSQHFDLVKHFYLVIEKARINSITQVPDGNDKYVINYDYFLSNSDKEFKKIKLNKSSLLKCFSDKESEIKDYVKENKLEYDKIADLIKIFSYYENLN